jgi:hypothetical protein
MDEILAQRYMALFLAYDFGGRGTLASIKQRIQHLTPMFFRPDAALLLLSLYDQMILRPYSGPIFSLNQPAGEWMPVPSIGRDLDAFMGRVNQSFDLIHGQLETTAERPVSSHQVLRAILNSWPTISELFGWA